MKNVILFVFVFILINCSSLKKGYVIAYDYTNYYKEVSKADSLFVIKEYKKSKELFETIFSKVEPINTFRYSEYYLYLLSKHYTGDSITKKEIENLIVKYGKEKSFFKKENVISKYYNRYVSDSTYHILRTKYVNSINLDLRNDIANMVEEDQMARTLYEGEEGIKKMKEIDSINQNKIKLLFDKGIYPSKKLVGNLFFDDVIPNLELLLLHTPDKERFDYYLPKLKQFIREGKTNPYIYCMLVDQYQLYNDKPQLYGTYNVHELDKKDFAFYNKNRQKLNIGMPSMEFDFWWNSNP